MAILKSIKIKDKKYILKIFDNHLNDNPAKVIFKRFPFPDETFPYANQKSVLESDIVKSFDNTNKAKEKLVEHIINTMIENITANKINYKLFIEECVDHFEDLEYENKNICSVNDFFDLPQEAVILIAQELYLYAKINDEFTIEQKKI